jgi:hypothetical protein
VTAALGEAAVGATGEAGAVAAGTGGRAAAGASASKTASGPKPLKPSNPKVRQSRSSKVGDRLGGRAKSRATRAVSGGGGGDSKGPALLTAARKTVSPSKARLRRRGARQVLVVEFVVCALILALSPLTDKHKSDTPGDWMKRATAICGLFVILGLVASGGPRASKAAAGLGGLVTLTLAMTDRDLFVVIAKRFGAPVNGGPAGPESPDRSGAGAPDGPNPTDPDGPFLHPPRLGGG